jgi:hypothetical protein
MGADGWNDPHDLVPQAFKNTFPEHDTVRDALRHAERLKSSTPPEDRAGTCPECDSISISPIGTGQREGSANDWKCNECEHRFTDPNEPDMNRYNHTAHYRFQFLDEDDLVDPDRRTALDPPFADVARDTAVAIAILLRRPWREEGERRSYGEIARYLPYEDSWVGHRVREWRDGEHRELVPDPPAEPEPAPSNEPPIDPSVAVARIGGDYDELVAKRGESNDASSDAAAVADGGRPPRRWAAYGSD